MTVTYTPSPTGTGEVAARKWYDGLGRLVREQGPMVDGQAQFVGYQYQDDGSVLERRGVTTGIPLPEGFDNQYFADPLHAQNAGDTVTSAVLREYDLAGRLTLEQTTYLDGGGGVRTETRTIDRTFDDDLLVVAETDPHQSVTTTYFDAYGRVTEIVYPVPLAEDADGNWLPSPVVKFTYYPNGRVKEQIETHTDAPANDPQARKTSYLYDSHGRVLAETVGDVSTLYQYDKLDRVVEERKGGTIIEHRYNTHGQEYETETRDANGNVLAVVQRKFDEVGMVVYTKDQNGDETFYEYDGLDRLVKTREPDTSFVSDIDAGHAGEKRTEYVYNAAGVLTDVYLKNEAGATIQRTTYNQYDELGRAHLTHVEGGGTGAKTTAYEFDSAGNVTKLTQYAANGSPNITTYQYDGLNRVVREGINIGSPGNATSAQFRTWLYDANGNLERFTDRDGAYTVYGYDQLNRRISATSHNGANSPSDKIELVYDRNGNLDAAKSYTYNQNLPENERFVLTSDYRYDLYDSRGRARTITRTISAFGSTQTVKFTYDYSDELTSGEQEIDTARSGYTVRAEELDGTTFYENKYQFDALGRQVWASQDTPDPNNAKQVVTSYSASQEQTVRAQKVDGIFKTVVKSTITYETQDHQNVTAIGYFKADDTALQTADGRTIGYYYNYDLLDRLRRLIDRTNNVTTPVTKIGDVPQSVTAMQSPYGRVQTVGDTIDIAYDLEGHVIGLTDSATTPDTAYGYVWHANNQLAKSTIDKAGTANDGQTLFRYDAFGNLVAKQTSVGTTYLGAQLFFFDGGSETLRFDQVGTGSLTQTVTEFYGADGELLAVDQIVSPTDVRTYWTLADKDQSVRDLVRLDGTQLTTATVNYDARGAATVPGGMAGLDIAVVRYQGRSYHGSELGYYDGRQWTTPLLDAGALSPASSVADNRYGRNDNQGQRQGLESESAWRAFYQQGAIGRTLQVIGGAAQVVAGAAWSIGTGGVGVVVGGGLAIGSGIDDIYHGFTGGETWKSQAAKSAAKSLGASSYTQQVVGMGADVIGGLVGGGAVVTKGLRILGKGDDVARIAGRADNFVARNAFGIAKPAAVAQYSGAGKLYESRRATRFISSVADAIGAARPGQNYRVLRSLEKHVDAFTDIIDNQLTIVVGPQFFRRSTAAVRELAAAHELTHVDDILNLGINRARQVYKTSRAAVEVSVQNRAMGKLMDYYGRIGAPLPDAAINFHMDYLYGKNGWATSLYGELDDWIKYGP